MPPFGAPGRPVPVMVTLDTSLPPFGSGSFPAVLLTMLVTAISARETMFVGSLAVSLVVVTSPPPETDAVLVTDAAADCATLTVIAIAGNEALLATTAGLVQVTTCSAIPQVELGPDAAVGVSPAGRVSVTVLVPLVAPPPMLLTVKP